MLLPYLSTTLEQSYDAYYQSAPAAAPTQQAQVSTDIYAGMLFDLAYSLPVKFLRVPLITRVSLAILTGYEYPYIFCPLSQRTRDRIPTS
jgi:hypothetical protein